MTSQTLSCYTAVSENGVEFEDGVYLHKGVDEERCRECVPGILTVE